MNVAGETGAPPPLVIDALQYSNWDRPLLEELRCGGVTAVHATVAFWEDARATLAALARWNRLFARHADLIRPVRSGADIQAAQREGRTGMILGFQNATPIEDDAGLVEVFHTLGVRVMQLTYNMQGLLGTGYAEATDAGLTRFGRAVIREMNRLGMVVDLSHCGERTTLDAIAASERPVAVTHANPRFFHDVPRNKSEAVLRSLAEHGGMLGFSLYPLHLPGAAACRLDEFCAMAARTAEILGVERIGVGSDVCRGWGYEVIEYMRHGRWHAPPGEVEGGRAEERRWPKQPAWFETPADFSKLASGLRTAGFGSEEVAKILGGNWLRFFGEGFRPA